MKKLILCLGSGGIRGFTHIGVLRALEESRIPISAYFGTSVGSLVSVFAAAGFSSKEIEEKALSLKLFDLVDLCYPKNGFIKGQKLKKFIEKNTTVQNIENLEKPVRIFTTNTQTGAEKIFTTGQISERVQASCAIPNVFRPVVIDNEEYLDGDLNSPVPMKAARKEFPAGIILGVNIIARIDQAPRNHRKWAKWIAKDIYRRTLVEHEKHNADIYLDLDIGYFGDLQKSWAKYQIQVGHKETLKIIPQLRQLLDAV